MTTDITRREALVRAAWILGGTVSAPTILGVLAGCARERGTAWVPRTLTPGLRDTVSAIAEAIIPATDTPGARAVGVDQFIDAMLTDYYAPADRDRFLSGLVRVEAQSRRAYGRGFNELSADQQSAMVRDMDHVAFKEPPGTAGWPSRSGEPPASVRKGDVATEQGVGANPQEAATVAPDPEDIGPQSFFRMMKELAVVGYYTSQAGQTQELRLTPWGQYRDIPYKPGTPAWAG